jgi:hypothetical protein
VYWVKKATAAAIFDRLRIGGHTSEDARLSLDNLVRTGEAIFFSPAEQRSIPRWYLDELKDRGYTELGLEMIWGPKRDVQ